MIGQEFVRRRGFMTAAIAGLAGYATSLVVSKPALAAECVANCTQSVNACLWPIGVCIWESNSFVQYVFYNKPPVGECCTGPGGSVECYTFGGPGACGY